MDFDRESFEATSEVMALATICEQTPMGEVHDGIFAFAYGRDGEQNAMPGENRIGFTMIDIREGLGGNLATNSMVSKILSSGQIFEQDGGLSRNLENNFTGASDSLDTLRNSINPCYIKVDKGQVRELNEFLINTLGGCDKWARGFVERARVLRDMSSYMQNGFVQNTVEKLAGYVQLARDVNRKEMISRINDNVQSR